MKAFALVRPNEFGWAELPDAPPPGPGEVTVQPKACGVCGSDVHYWQHGRISDQVIEEYPYVLGHECSGVVAAVGEGVTNVAVGARVAVEPGVPCGQCRPCREGRENICPHVRFLASPPVQGALCERLTLPARNVEPIPDSLSFEDAALCEPFGVGIHATRLVGVAPSETAAVFGAGPIGLSTAVAAQCRGAGRVLLVEPIPERRGVAEAMGFEAVDVEPDPVGRIHEMTDGGADVTFEAAGEPEAMRWTTAAARLGGRACIIGIPADETVAFDIHRLRRAELTVWHCRRSNRLLDEAVRLIAGEGSALRRMATHRFPLAEAQTAFRMVAERADGVVKAMLLLD